MNERRNELLEALRAHLDLGEDSERLQQALGEASEPETRELLDRLMMDTLLLDTFGEGGERSEESARRGEARARRGRTLRLRWGALAAAAVLLVAFGIAFHLCRPGPGYPAPEAMGDFAIESGGEEAAVRRSVRRGDRLTAEADGASLKLGGYCELSLSPNTSVVLAGEPGKEVIELEDGKVLSHVQHDKGEFKVVTPRGHLEVVGTEFEVTVKYPISKGGSDMTRSRKSAVVTVAVISGAVAYLFGDLAGSLTGGMAQAFGADTVKKIAFSKPRYNPKNHPAWKEKGRIVGHVRGCPGCKVQALDDKTKKAVCSSTVKAGAKAYELESLKPGKYILLVTAEGYEALDVHNLVVKVMNDIRIDLEF